MIADSQQQPGNGETMKPQRTLEELEAAIADGLPRHTDAMYEVGLALLDIHGRKLYLRGYRSFEEYLLRRWGISRARGYQLLHFARVKLMSTTVDTSDPDNERQARALDASGKPRRQREEDPVMRAMNYLANLFYRLDRDMRRNLVDSVGGMLREMESELNREETQE